MIRVLVFDLSWGAMIIGSYIEKEIPVQVKLVIDDKDKYQTATDRKIKEYAVEKISEYAEEVDVIVLADIKVADVAKKCLERRFPGKSFVKYGWDLPEIVEKYEKTMILASNELRETKVHRKMEKRCLGSEVKELDSDKWEKLMKRDKAEIEEYLDREVGDFTGERLVIGCSKFLLMKSRLEDVLGWKVEVIDMCPGVVAAINECLGMKEKGCRIYTSRNLERL